MSAREDERIAIAGRFRDARVAAGLTQVQLARLMGLHRPAVTDIESAKRKLAAEEIVEASRLLRVRAGWLLGETEEAAPPLGMAARVGERLSQEDYERLVRLLRSLARDAE